MNLNGLTELRAFLSSHLMDSDVSTDKETLQSYLESVSAETRERVTSQLKRLGQAPSVPVEEFGSEANRWFSDETEVRAWLESPLTVAQGANASGSAMVVKDSNGAPLVEGDSVLVIKDLKVKGGTSDLKRGTLVRKIHLVDDPEVVECRVDGSTLVLKTCFLKKA
jgi:protein PhnA